MDSKILDFFKNDRFAALAGIEVEKFETGQCLCKLNVEEKHLNAANMVQGGAIFTLADYAFAIASNSHGLLALAIQVNISFIKSVSSGVLYAQANEFGNPKKLGHYEVKVFDGNNEIVALFNGIVYRKTEVLSF